jgi:hypothetical protein
MGWGEIFIFFYVFFGYFAIFLQSKMKNKIGILENDILIYIHILFPIVNRVNLLVHIFVLYIFDMFSRDIWDMNTALQM